MFFRLLEFSSVVTVFRNAEERPTAKNHCRESVVRKVFDELVNDRIVEITFRNVTIFLISSMVLGLLNQLQIF